MTYTTPVQEDEIRSGNCMSKAMFIDAVRTGDFQDYNGHGHPTKGGMMDKAYKIFPSFVGTRIHTDIGPYSEGDFPDDADGIVWFNK